MLIWEGGGLLLGNSPRTGLLSFNDVANLKRGSLALGSGLPLSNCFGTDPFNSNSKICGAWFATAHDNGVRPLLSLESGSAPEPSSSLADLL